MASESSTQAPKIFLCYRSADKVEVEELIEDIAASDSFEFDRHDVHEDSEEKWQKAVKAKMLASDAVVFLVGREAMKSAAIKWEYEQCMSMMKEMKVYLLKDGKAPAYFENAAKIKIATKDRIRRALWGLKLRTPDDLLLDQYQMMVSSTEKVTDQRLKVNTLFVTMVTTVLSAATVAGNIIGFSTEVKALTATGIMAFFTLVALVLTFFWDRLVRAYGALNTGKFIVITELEDRIKTNLYQREWEVLENKVGYRSNTKTETRIILGFQVFLIIILVAELGYLASLVLPMWQGGCE